MRRECQHACTAEKSSAHPSRKGSKRSREGQTRSKGERYRHGGATGNGRSRIAHPKNGGRAQGKRRKNARGERRSRRKRQRSLQNRSKHGTETCRTCRTGCPEMAFGRIAIGRRRGIFGKTQRWQIYPVGGGIGSQTQDCELSVHNHCSKSGSLRYQRRGCRFGLVRYSGFDRGGCGRCWTRTRIPETRPAVQGSVACRRWER
mmetsp:Transcript_15813/g.36423  ORF Transcript_15813/g.36423 Transcript_15813/m.36423 type:complete len:203 (+) Transcript_15813:674-1282(+)